MRMSGPPRRSGRDPFPGALSIRGGASVSGRALITHHVFGERRRDLRGDGNVLAYLAVVRRIAASLEDDMVVAHPSDGHRRTLIAPRDVVIGGEDGDAAIQLADIVLDLPFLRRT